jgi:hypothetical protein
MLRLVRPDETFYVNDQDQIYRVGRCATSPSDQWRLRGAVELRMVFGRLVQSRRFSVKDIREGRVPWKFKNGSQRCFVLDFDHGANRMWGSPGHHAIGTVPPEPIVELAREVARR